MEMKVKKGISAHCIVKNEENWIWYAINSVLGFVDELFVYDTGSQDKTVEIIKSVKSSKITFKSVNNASGKQMTELYQEMIERTKTDWIVVLDGDEIWFEDPIKSLREFIFTQGGDWLAVITPFYNLVGDIYHHQEAEAGRYQIGPYKGHLTIRAMNKSKIPGFKAGGLYRTQGYFDENGTQIQNLDYRRFFRSDKPFFHMTHLPRSSHDERIAYPEKRKRKCELGSPFPYDFYYPEVFFRSRPDIVPTPWTTRTLSYTALAAGQWPLRWLKRRLLE